jgi:hypothetical protein
MRNLREREQRELLETRKNIQNTPASSSAINDISNLLINPNMPKI